MGTAKFEARIKELVEDLPDLAVLVEPLLVVRRVLREQFVILHRRLLAIVRDDEVCRRLMTTPGVGVRLWAGWGLARRPDPIGVFEHTDIIGLRADRLHNQRIPR